MTNQHVGLVVFDFDNTLVHSRIDFLGIRRELIALLRAHQVTAESDDALVARSIGQIIELAALHDASHGTDFARTAWHIVLEFERAGMREATIEDGAADTLTALKRAGLSLVVLTNNARPATLEALDKFGLRPAFDLILTRDEVPMKPDPAGILLARSSFEHVGRRAVMVGDSWLDGTAAHLAGVPFIAFQPRAGALEARGIPVWHIVDRLQELPALLAGCWPTPRSPDGREHPAAP